MRNLKKILALVLALVMSLSLMATAGAADFTDASSINEKYETAVEVLEGLGVFRGYEDGSFQPTGSITRAETAAIIYRIVTGDVKDEQVGIYADYNLFTDVPSTAWYAGYVNYCANAEYIKGYNGKFNPNSQVTGYAALAMILRAIGYTANGGFTGPDWEVQTARVGESRKITKNILTGTLGQPATRESVAEILFQAILVDMVDHNVLHTENGSQGYTVIEGQTLGYKTFGLESIEGVVVANEYANLNGSRVIAKNKTDLKVSEDETLRLSKGTKITDIGESRYAYVTGKGANVLAFGDTGKNKVTETGKAVDIGSASKFAAVAEMSSNANTEFYSNFEPNNVGNYTCDQRLEFSVVFYGEDAEKAFDAYKGIDISKIAAADDEWSVEVNTGTETSPAFTATELNTDATDYAPGKTVTAYKYPVRYTKIIWAGEDITPTDLLVLESIFGTADNANNNVLTNKKITGDVFVGTKSTNPETEEERDLSNTISYKKFFEEYINANTDTYNWSLTWNGWWTKFVDNNGDGTAEYAFRTVYSLEDTLYTFTDRDGNTYFEYNDFDDENDAVVYLDGYTPAVGNKVLAAKIDGQYLVEPAQSENVVVSAYSWRNDEITTDKGTYGQSGIINATNMLELISTMEEKVEYVVYFDHYGYVRAYELPGSTRYALITELTYGNNYQGNVVQEWPMEAELSTLEEDGSTLTQHYNVTNGAGTFLAKQPWMRVVDVRLTANVNNWLQPAIAHLGVTVSPYAPTKGTPEFVAASNSNDDHIGDNAYVTFWNANNQLVRDIKANGMDGRQEFNYGKQTYSKLYKDANKADYNWDVAATASFTNVALVNIDGNNASLTGAATLNLDKAAQIVAKQPYATDYVQLSIGDIAKGAVRYPIGGDDDYIAANNNYVNAVHDTQYFIAYNGGVYSFTDYVNFPGLDKDDNQIHAAYAVARNTNSDVNGKPYWVADVIVYEIYAELDSLTQTSVSLAYYVQNKATGQVQNIKTLNSKYGDVDLQPQNLDWWNSDWEGLGFYALYNDTEPVENVMTARTIEKITIGKYGKYNVHAGTVTREAYIDGAGEYIDLDLGDGRIVSIEVNDNVWNVSTGNSHSGTQYPGYNSGSYDYNYAWDLRYERQTASNVRLGDSVIWVGGAATNGTKSAANFIVDLGSETKWTDTNAVCGVDLLAGTAEFLIDTYKDPTTGALKISSYAAATNSDGVYQQIMKEQNTTPTVKVTATAILNGSDPETVVDGIVTLDSNALLDPTDVGNPVYIKSSALASNPNLVITVAAPYEIVDVIMTNAGENGAGKNAEIVATNVPGTYKLVGVSANVDLKVVVEKAEKTLTIDNQTGAALGATVNGTAYAAAVKMVKGTAYTVEITVPTNTTYAVNGVKATPVAGKITLTGNLNDDVTYTITKLTKTLTLMNSTGDALTFNLKNGTETVNASWTGAQVTLNEGAEYVITFNANGNTYAINGTKQTAASGVITYRGTLNADTTLVLTKLTKTLSVTNNAGVASFSLKVNGTLNDATWDGTAKTLPEDATYEITFAAVANTTYAVDGTEKAKDASNNIVISGTLAANKNYVISKLEATLKVNAAAATGATNLEVLVNNANVTAAAQTTDGTTANKGASYRISFQPNAGYNYTVDGTPMTAATTGADAGKIVVTGTLTANKTVVIAASEKTINVTVKGTNVKTYETGIDVSAGAVKLDEAVYVTGGTAGEIVVNLTDAITGAPGFEAASYTWPETITVTMDGKLLRSGYTWDRANHKVAFTANIDLTGDLVITVNAVPTTYTVGTLNGLTIAPAGTVGYKGTVTVSIDGTVDFDFTDHAPQYKIGNGAWTDLDFNVFGEATITGVTGDVEFRTKP